jgi:hypothetical protein
MCRPSARACPDSLGNRRSLSRLVLDVVESGASPEGATEIRTAARPEASRLTGSWQMPQAAAVLRSLVLVLVLDLTCQLPGQSVRSRRESTDVLYCSKGEVRTNILIPALLKPVLSSLTRRLKFISRESIQYPPRLHQPTAGSVCRHGW